MVELTDTVSSRIVVELPKTVLAFDFGLRRIGVAYGQAVTGTASPVGTLLAKEGVPDWTRVLQWIREWRPGVLAVGIPLLLDGSEQKISQAARRFASQLAERVTVPVKLVDERMTTKAARLELSERSEGKIFNHEKVDALAACLIAETCLAALQLGHEFDSSSWI